MNIASWLHSTAIKTPDNPALFHGSELRANYAQFAQSASAVGTYLKQTLKVSPGDRVALFMKNRTEYLQILYGAWWVGAVVVPINGKLHPKEVAWIVESAEPKVLFTESGTLGQSTPLLTSCQEISVTGDAFQAILLASVQSTAPVHFEPPMHLKSNTLAWLFYTSGTTGRPKGVMISHDNLIAMSTCYTVDVDDVSSEDAALYAAPLSHGAGLYNFIHVRQGARHVVPASRGFEPLEILNLAQALGRISMFAAPTMVKRLVDAAKAAGLKGEGIKSIIYGGGPMYVADIEQALAALGPRFIQIYGQGECPMTITALQRELIAGASHPMWRQRLGSVGSAQSCVEVRVVDDNMHVVPPGTPGEIIVSGATVMQGYWRNDKATRESIIDGWLKTGDIGCLDEQGFLTLTDRSKDVIISGGTNIYPREVEEVLLRCPGVSEVAVVGQHSNEWGEDVVAFIVTEPGAKYSEQSLDSWCRQEMAGFKRPKRYVQMDSLPKNNTGKVLKTELREILKNPSR